MQTIPIIITEKILKKIFLEAIQEINKFFTHTYEIIDEYSENVQSSPALIIDRIALENISNFEIKNQKLFIINSDHSSPLDLKNNQILIDRPFKILELFSQIENNINQINKREQKKIKFNQHTFDPIARTLYKDKNSIRLTEKESEIFLSLIESRNAYLSKKFLLQKVWQYNQDIDTHTLETHLYSLRKKIDDKLGTKNLIIHEEKKGYLINRKLL
tara:strand:+ start:1001 stop:1648 length:648 start_codon:yes stop_codon:yes gene_type:complete